MTKRDRSFLSEVISTLTRAGFKAHIPTGRDKRAGFGARAFFRGEVSLFDYYGADRETFARVCEALVCAGYALTDCTPARGSDYVRLGAARVTRAA